MVIVAINSNAEVVREGKIPTSPKALDGFFGSLNRPLQAVVAKELAKIVWHMLSKDEKYKGFKGQPTRVAQQTCWPQPISPLV